VTILHYIDMLRTSMLFNSPAFDSGPKNWFDYTLKL